LFLWDQRKGKNLWESNHSPSKTHKDKVDETEGTLKSTKIKVVEKTGQLERVFRLLTFVADKIGKTFEERLQALLFQQGKCLILLLRFPQRILHVLGSLFNSYLKLHLPESAFFNQPTQDGEDTDMEEEALPDTGNMFDDMFSASQTQERQQVGCLEPSSSSLN
jgi:hypothetical protein